MESFSALRRRSEQIRKIKRRIIGFEWLSKCELDYDGIHVRGDDELINRILKKYDDFEVRGEF